MLESVLESYQTERRLQHNKSMQHIISRESQHKHKRGFLRGFGLSLFLLGSVTLWVMHQTVDVSHPWPWVATVAGGLILLLS